MRRCWNQSCHITGYREAEPSEGCFSRQIVEELSLIDDGSTQPGRELKSVIAARQLTKLNEKNGSGSTFGDASNRIARGCRSVA